MITLPRLDFLDHISRYFMEKTVVIERQQLTAEAVKDPEIPFLELSICPSYHAAYKDDLLASYGISKDEYRKAGHYFPSIIESDMDLHSIFQEITYNASELFHRIVFYVNDNEQYKFVINFENEDTLKHLHIATKYWPSFGRCYSIRPDDDIVKLGINRVDVAARQDFYVYFGHPGQFMYSTKTKVSVFVFQMIGNIAPKLSKIILTH